MGWQGHCALFDSTCNLFDLHGIANFGLVRRSQVRLPRLVVADGSIEALKWLGLLLMTGDHVNKYLLNGVN
ncbi:MAG: hypothetical protein EOO38_26620, partial [Cytophagaceae bacterium]